MDHLEAIEHQVPEFRLIARDPQELEQSRVKLIAFSTAKLNSLDGELKQLEQNLAIAKSASMNTKPIASRIQLLRKRLRYYEKVSAALEKGFHIVPNFVADVFAIRTNRSSVPAVIFDNDQRNAWDVQRLTGALPPAPMGEGSYVSDRPQIGTFLKDVKEGDKIVPKTHYYGEALVDEIDFPFALARPEVLTATQQVMAMNIFDELAVLPSRRPSGDPMVVGIIKEGNHWSAKRLTFLVVWFLDTNTL
jgi:hypothetical protein